jgi:hypothetical protein
MNPSAFHWTKMQSVKHDSRRSSSSSNDSNNNVNGRNIMALTHTVNRNSNLLGVSSLYFRLGKKGVGRHPRMKLRLFAYTSENMQQFNLLFAVGEPIEQNGSVWAFVTRGPHMRRRVLYA